MPIKPPGEIYSVSRNICNEIEYTLNTNHLRQIFLMNISPLANGLGIGISTVVTLWVKLLKNSNSVQSFAFLLKLIQFKGNDVT